MKTSSHFVCLPLVWLLIMGCASSPEHDNPVDPASPDFAPPFEGLAYLESPDGGSCVGSDSCVVVAVLRTRDGAPEVEEVWVQLCGSEQSGGFVNMTEETEQRWVHRFSQPSVGLVVVPPETGSGRGLDNEPIPKKSRRQEPCWFVVRDVDCEYYLVGPVSVGR